MTNWILFAAPLIVASLVLLLGFVGCFLDSTGEAPPTHYRDTVISNTNLVSYWRLGEDGREAGTTANDSADGNDGTYTGNVAIGQPGLLAVDNNTAAQFDGSSGYVAVPHNANLNPPAFTVEAIVTVTGGDGTYRAVVSSRDVSTGLEPFGYILYASETDLWEAWVGDGVGPPWTTLTGPAVTQGQHFLAMTYDGTTLTLHVDPEEGNPDTTVSTATAYMPNTTNELRIGAGANEATPPLYFWNGVLDEVAVYNAALDFSTIQNHFEVAQSGFSLQVS
jgi:hypothetical protein